MKIEKTNVFKKVMSLALAISLVAAAGVMASANVDAAVKKLSKEEMKKARQKPVSLKEQLKEKGKTLETVKKPKKGQTREAAGDINLVPEKDAYIKLSELKTLTKEKILKEMKFAASYSLTGEQGGFIEETDWNKLVANTSINPSDLLKLQNTRKVGSYELPITYNVPELAGIVTITSLTQSFNINVVDDKLTSYDDDIYGSLASVHSNNFDVTVEQAKTLDLNKIKSNDLVELQAWDSVLLPVLDPETKEQLFFPGKELNDKITTNADQIKAINDAGKASINEDGNGGVFKLKFAVDYQSVQEKEATVFMTNKNTVIDRNKDIILLANDFRISFDDAKVLTSDVAKDMSKAQAYTYKYAEKIDDSKISIDTSKVNAATAAGEFEIPVTVTDAGKTVKTNIKVTVTAGEIVKNQITAENFELTLAESNTVTNEELIKKAGAYGWEEKNPSVKLPVQVKESKIEKGKKGIYEVTFNIVGKPDVEITVKAVVGGKYINGHAIFADDFVLESKAVDTVTDAQLITKANAYATKLSDMSDAPLKVLSKTIAKPEGNYKATFAVITDEEIKETVDVRVVNGTIIGEYLVKAEDFEVKLGEAATITNDQIISKAKATATHLVTNAAGKIKVVKNEIKAVPGKYNVEFGVVEEPTATNTEKVIATVVDDTPPIITANETQVYKKDSKNPTTITEAQLLKDIDAKTDIGTQITTDYDESMTTLANGEHIKIVDVTLNSKNGNADAKPVKVKVTTVSERVEVGKTYVLYAEAFSLTIMEARSTATTSGAGLVHERSKAYAFNYITGEKVENKDIVPDSVVMGRLKIARLPGKHRLNFDVKGDVNTTVDAVVTK